MTEHRSIKKEFSQEDRANLRAVLIEYMKEHDIGVPTLQLRIAKATGREPHLLPLKTLQRFLADTTRTNDALLSLCFQFAETVGQRTETDALSQAAEAFFDSPKKEDSRFALIGRWSGTTTGNKSSMVLLRGGKDESTAITSQMTIDRMPKSSGLKIKETVINPAADQTTEYDSGFHLSYEGIALQFSPLVCIILKNMLTNLPRTYWLRLSDSELEGHGTEAIFGAKRQLVSDLMAFKFERITDEGGHNGR
jgi:hypothetical protein